MISYSTKNVLVSRLTFVLLLVLFGDGGSERRGLGLRLLDGGGTVAEAANDRFRFWKQYLYLQYEIQHILQGLLLHGE